MSTNTGGMAGFLTIFPGYYNTRSVHIHLTVQTNVTSTSAEDYSYSAAKIQHVGQLFFNESLINSVYELDPYSAHLETLNRTTNDEDSVYSVANADGYSSIISVQLLGDTIADGLAGFTAVGVNRSSSVSTFGNTFNPLGVIPTVSVTSSVRAAAATVDVAD
jgi:hypothetical protein